MTASRQRSRTLLALLSLLLVGPLAACGVGNSDGSAGSVTSSAGSSALPTPSPTPTPSDPPSAAESSLARLAAALPAPGRFPTDAVVSYCPGGDSCPEWDDERDTVGVHVELGEASEGRWYAPSTRLELMRFADGAAAAREVDAFDAFAAQRTGDFSIEPSTSDDGQESADEQGSGTVEPVEVGEWAGRSLAATTSYSTPDSGPSAP